MIDYILKFDDEVQAISVLQDWTILDENGAVHWHPKPKCGILPIEVILQESVWDSATDPENPVETTAEIRSDGYWMAIAMTMPDDILWAMPYVVSEHSRALANSGQDHLLRTKMTTQQIAGVIGIRPVYAGSNYPF